MFEFLRLGTRRSLVEGYARKKDVIGLHQAIFQKELNISDVELSLQRALKEGQHAFALFYLSALALAGEEVSFRKSVFTAFGTIPPGPLWALGTDQIQHWLQALKPKEHFDLFRRIPVAEWSRFGDRICLSPQSYFLETLGAWMAAGMSVAGMDALDTGSAQRSACTKLFTKLSQVSPELLSQLGHLAAKLRGDVALMLAVAGVNYRSFVQEILPALLLEHNLDDLRWDRVMDIDFELLVREFHTSAPLWEGLLKVLPESRLQRALEIIPDPRTSSFGARANGLATKSVLELEQILAGMEHSDPAFQLVANRLLQASTPQNAAVAEYGLDEELTDRVVKCNPPGWPELEWALRDTWRQCRRENRPPSRNLLNALVAGLPRMPMRQATVAAGLLALDAQPEWQFPLKELWLRVTAFGQGVERGLRTFENLQVWEEMESIADQLAFRVADALMRASIESGEIIDFRDDEELCREVREIEQHLDPLVSEYQAIRQDYRKLDENEKALGRLLTNSTTNPQFHGHMRKQELIARLERLEKSIQPLHRKRDVAWQRIEPQLSPAWLFLSTLQRARHMPAAQVQASAAALAAWIAKEPLDSTATTQVRSALIAVFRGEAARQFRERLVRVLPDADVTELRDAVRSGLEWMLALQPYLSEESFQNARSPAPDVELESAPASQDNDTSISATASDEAASDDVPATDPAACKSESTSSMDDSASAQRVSALDSLADYQHLDAVVDVLVDRLPGVARFIERYPLRLMRFGDHKRAFGVYAEHGAEIECWYSYNRPQKDGGEVSERFLRVNNRRDPNGIGLDYRLLRHPLLAVPVLYHEFLHYGGPQGNPEHGIRNELDVLLREIAFAKGLLVDLAPVQDDQLEQYESGIIDACKQADDVFGLVLQWLGNPFDDMQLAVLNREIPRLYEARTSLVDLVHQENFKIHRANEGIEWCGWIEWPMLGPETACLTREYVRLRTEHAHIRHEVTPEARDQIRAEPLVQQWLANWERYTQRPGSLKQLQLAHDDYDLKHSLDAIQKIRLMALRFVELIDSSVAENLASFLDLLRMSLPSADEELPGTDEAEL